MKSITRHIKLVINYLYITTLLTGCIRDKSEDCNSYACFHFQYLYNTNYQDRFQEEVDHIDLFIYNENGSLFKHLQEYQSEMHDGYIIRTELPVGKYTVIAWGNCHTDNYKYVNKETIQSLTLSLDCIEDGIVNTHNPGLLFHSINTLEMHPGKETITQMPMIKNNSNIRVVLKGISLLEENLETGYRVRLTGHNGVYKHDNTLATDDEITYIPQYHWDEDVVTTEFNVLRLFGDDDRMSLSLAFKDESGEWQIAQKITLLTYLLLRDQPEDVDDYLNRNDLFEIVFTLNLDIDGNIIIEEWDELNQPGNLK